jgi:uncharacterized protein (DUF2147 family)
MKGTFVTICAVLFSLIILGQTAAGKWKTIDDETGRVKSIVEIKERDGLMYGKVVELFRLSNEDQNPKCNDCSDDRKGKLVMGMEILRDMKWNGSMYKNGSICDPKNGKVYTCEMWLKPGDPNTLIVRGYWGFIYRTQNWVRVK